MLLCVTLHHYNLVFCYGVTIVKKSEQPYYRLAGTQELKKALKHVYITNVYRKLKNVGSPELA